MRLFRRCLLGFLYGCGFRETFNIVCMICCYWSYDIGVSSLVSVWFSFWWLYDCCVVSVWVYSVVLCFYGFRVSVFGVCMICLCDLYVVRWVIGCCMVFAWCWMGAAWSLLGVVWFLYVLWCSFDMPWLLYACFVCVYDSILVLIGLCMVAGWSLYVFSCLSTILVWLSLVFAWAS